MMRHMRLAVVAAMILACCSPAGARLRMRYEDAAVAQRSELIVVGRLDKDSIKYVQHPSPPGSGISWEHHATLVVTETLKGSVKEKRIPIVINYGLDPRNGGRFVRAGDKAGGPADNDIPADQIDIIDTGNSDMGGPPVLTGAEKDNLWFLRHLGGELGREPGKGPLGIRDPEDVAPLKFKDYFAALLSKDVDKQIDRLLAGADCDVRLRCLRHISTQHRPEDAKRIVSLVSGSDRTVEGAAAETLAEVADVSSVPTFRELLDHRNPSVRTTACSFLCRFRDKQSIPAVAKVLPGLDSIQRASVITNLPRMESREVVGMLLEQLDEHSDPGTPSSLSSYQASTAAAAALKTLTGIEFPLDTAQGRRLWDRYKGFSDEVLLRKSMLEDIEALTSKASYQTRWDAYEALGRLANQHFGSYNAFHDDKDAAAMEQSLRLWRDWAGQNITRPRVDWIYGGFAASGIALPPRTDPNCIDMLIKVLDFYGDWSKASAATSRPQWSTDGGWVKANFHRYNANWLLEQLTGYKVGLSPYHYDLKAGDGNVAVARWTAWWKDNCGKVPLRKLAEATAVTDDAILKVPSLRLPPPPLSLTVRQKQADGKPAIIVEIKNVSDQDVVVEDRPYELRYSSDSGGGTFAVGGRGGAAREDFETLKPGQSLTWLQADTPSQSNLQYEVTYCFAGSRFGLHAWRGKLHANVLNPGSGTQP